MDEPSCSRCVFCPKLFSMKKILFIATFLVPFIASAQTPLLQYVKSEIKQVKLFLTSGEMLHEQPITILKGRNKLVFSGISAFADPQSIQFVGDGKYRLVSVSTEMDFLAAESFNPRIAVLKDSLEALKDKHQANEDQIGAYQIEQDLLSANKKR